LLLLNGCLSVPPEPPISNNVISVEHDNQAAQESNTKEGYDEVRQAYLDYLNYATVDEKTRIDALVRLAELEYSDGQKLLAGEDAPPQALLNDDVDKLYQQHLERTIDLLEQTLKDYPKAHGNDKLLYQLAKVQSQAGDLEASIRSLVKLTENYPRSRFYVEAQFRIGEEAFTRQDYSSAEYAYTEVILSPDNQRFYEKALFKRGWARFKQQFYLEAIDDLLAAVTQHGFADVEKLTTAEREVFDEYFRGVGLSFSHLDGMQSLNQYFEQHKDFQYIYYSYSKLADLYLGQERYSDAVQSHEAFIQHFPKSDNIPYSQLKIIEIWKNSGFRKNLHQAVETFYVQYSPDSPYWKNQNENSRVNRAIRRALKEYVILEASYFHHRYQQSPKDQDFKQTELWYQRYLKHYASYAQQDKIYFLYAELLNQRKRYRNAFEYYQLAAFDNDLIIDQEAAYGAITSSDQLIEASNKDTGLVRQHIRIAINYSRQFTDDKRTPAIAIHAAELAFAIADYHSVIVLSDLLPASPATSSSPYITSLKADAYFHLNECAETEKIYRSLIQNSKQNSRQTLEYQDKLALAIYRQGETAQENQQYELAVHHFTRIANAAPAASHAATGLYDAIALLIEQQQWQAAIDSIHRFQKLYPHHPLNNEVSKKLSVAYLKSNQGVKAAGEFEKLADLDKDLNTQSTALWQAAKLYQQQGKIADAIRSYKKYINSFNKPYERKLDAMKRLAGIYLKQGDTQKSEYWLQQMVKTDGKTLNNAKTERSKLQVSNAYLTLARREKNRFDRLQLTLPLKNSLAQKKSSLQKAVKLYGNASLNKFLDITTEATHSIARIYQDFSHALLQSERPTNLNDEELDQYEILLEDQAFPFEDKAIEFYEINLSRIRDGQYNDWIGASHEQLIDLFPLRYQRKPKLERYIERTN
jgi:tetratricopeptide (TPR) repeat protein